MNLRYVCHPFGGSQDRLDNAERWVRWLNRRLPARFWAPWIHVCRKGDGSPQTVVDGLEIDKRCISLSRGILAVGGYISLGMAVEIAHAKSCGIPIADWSGIRSPYEVTELQARQLAVSLE